MSRRDISRSPAAYHCLSQSIGAGIPSGPHQHPFPSLGLQSSPARHRHPLATRSAGKIAFSPKRIISTALMRSPAPTMGETRRGRGVQEGRPTGIRWKHAAEHEPHSQDTCRERGALRRTKRNGGDSLIRYYGDPPARLPIDSSRSVYRRAGATGFRRRLSLSGQAGQRRPRHDRPGQASIRTASRADAVTRE